MNAVVGALHEAIEQPAQTHAWRRVHDCTLNLLRAQCSGTCATSCSPNLFLTACQLVEHADDVLWQCSRTDAEPLWFVRQLVRLCAPSLRHMQMRCLYVCTSYVRASLIWYPAVYEEAPAWCTAPRPSSEELQHALANPPHLSNATSTLHRILHVFCPRSKHAWLKLAFENVVLPRDRAWFHARVRAHAHPPPNAHDAYALDSQRLIASFSIQDEDRVRESVLLFGGFFTATHVLDLLEQEHVTWSSISEEAQPLLRLLQHLPEESSIQRAEEACRHWSTRYAFLALFSVVCTCMSQTMTHLNLWERAFVTTLVPGSLEHVLTKVHEPYHAKHPDRALPLFLFDAPTSDYYVMDGASVWGPMQDHEHAVRVWVGCLAQRETVQTRRMISCLQ